MCGTEILLTSASKCPSVRAFVFSSTVNIYADPSHTNPNEDQKLENSSSQTWKYGLTKVMADEMLRAANGLNLSTVNIIMAHTYGVRDNQSIPVTLDACMPGKLEGFPNWWLQESG